MVGTKAAKLVVKGASQRIDLFLLRLAPQSVLVVVDTTPIFAPALIILPSRILGLTIPQVLSADGRSMASIPAMVKGTTQGIIGSNGYMKTRTKQCLMPTKARAVARVSLRASVSPNELQYLRMAIPLPAMSLMTLNTTILHPG